MEILQKIENLLQLMQGSTSWEERYKKIIQMGKELEPMDEALKTDSNKVKGCQSQVWLSASLEGERIHFNADSDASIAKGIVALLLAVYNQTTPKEILSTRPEFIEQLGLKQHLSMNRANGLASMLKQIQIYAIAFQAKIDQGL